MPDIRRSTRLPKPDKRGRIRCFVGHNAGPQRAVFTVGDRTTSPAEASRRLELIRSLYERQCDEMKGPAVWREWARQVAVSIGKGERVTEATLPSYLPPDTRTQLVERLKAWGIPVEIEDPSLHSEGLKITQAELVRMVQQAVKQEVSKLSQWRGPAVETVARGLPENAIELADATTLHEAIDAYTGHLKATGDRDVDDNLSTFVRKCLDRLRYLKDAHEDRLLWQLDLPALHEIVSHWRNRPLTTKGSRCSTSHARDQLKELWQFLKWLDSHPGYRWQWPKGADKLKRTPIDLPQDDRGGVFQTSTKETYTPEQLALIANHCTDDFGRALIAVCVNCAFGASEIGQWSIKKFALHRPHPHADKIGIETTDADSWIVGGRPKTGIYGEHLLWPQVAEALKPFVEDGRSVLPVTAAGTRWYKLHSANPQTKFNRWWSDLVKRTQKSHPDLPRLPFGSLRDTLPDVLRQRFSDDVASLALQHGSLGEDQLLKCYANLPFRRLFDATKQLESYFKPLLDTLVATAAR